MNEPKHTPEPWRKQGTGLIIGGRAECLAECYAAINADRIVACVNAMAGIPGPAAYVEKVRTALEPFVKHNSSEDFILLEVSTEDIKRARAILSKLPKPEGGQS